MSISAERMIHGCWLAHPAWFSSIQRLFSEKDFTDPVDKKLWSVALACHEAGHEPTPVDALVALQGTEGGSDAVRQLVSLRDLCESETRESFDRRVDAFIKQCQAKRTRRIGLKLASAVDEGVEADWVDTLAKASEKLRAFDKRELPHSTLSAVLLSAQDFKEKKIPTGFTQLDEKAGGFDIGWLNLAACGVSGSGKSLLLQAYMRNQVFPNSAKYGISQAERLKVNTAENRPYMMLVTIENDADTFGGRFLADCLDIPAGCFQQPELLKEYQDDMALKGHPSVEDVAALAAEYGRISIVEQSDLSSTAMDGIGAHIEQWASRIRSEDPDARIIVFVDYLQEITPKEGEEKETRTKQIENASRALCALAKKFSIAMVVAVQQNDARIGELATKANNRDSHAPANLASNIWVVNTWRPAERGNLMRGGASDEVQGAYQMTSEKARFGLSGWTVPLHFVGNRTKLVDAPDPEKLWLLDADAKSAAKEADPDMVSKYFTGPADPDSFEKAANGPDDEYVFG